MMKIKFILLGIFLISMTNELPAQKLMERSGKITFFSEAPLENISATNEQVLAVLDTDDGRVAVSMLMKGFQFKKKLMQEHFNESYIESDKFPKATFTGIIPNYKKGMLQGTGKTLVSGELTIHGITTKKDILINYTMTKEELQVTSSFDVRVADHEISIPKLVVKNIAEVVEVSVEFNLKPE